MTDRDGMTAADLRASAAQLRAVLDAIDSGTLEAPGRQRAFIAGASHTLELMLERAEPRPAVDARSQITDRHNRGTDTGEAQRTLMP